MAFNLHQYISRRRVRVFSIAVGNALVAVILLLISVGISPVAVGVLSIAVGSAHFAEIWLSISVSISPVFVRVLSIAVGDILSLQSSFFIAIGNSFVVV